MPAVTASAPAGARRVLVIDDELAVLRVIGLLLERHGFVVDSAGSAREGLSLLAAKEFDVVLCDVKMPELSGLDFLREVRQRNPELPVILMTGGATLDAALGAIELHAKEFLLKPIEPAVLVESVARAAASGEPARMKRTLATMHAEFQPVVSLSKRSLFGYEASMRCDDLPASSYDALLLAAERVDWRSGLLHAFHERVGASCGLLPDGALLFVPVDPLDAVDLLPAGSGSPLAPVAVNVVLCVRGSVAGGQLRAIASALPGLRRAGFRIAMESGGTASLDLEIVEPVSPDFVRLVGAAFAGIAMDPQRRRTLRATCTMFAAHNVPLIAVGVETAEERDALLAAGVDLAEGGLFGTPSKTFESPAV
ncbi:MAG: response regulator [Gemmatimonadales bacterium]